MASSSSKRRRDVSDVDGNTEVEIESASSSFRQNFPKRSKVALAQARGGSVVSDTEEEDPTGHFDDLLEDDTHSPDPDNDYSLRDDSDNEQEGDEIDELRATQIVQKAFDKNAENIPMEEGVIEEIFCRNFMCHSALRIKLGPLINFIVGHNGSGKSAVLTALQMCLGGKAAMTGRAASMKSLIKTGHESATLAVKIKNQGENAYKHDLYGDSIIVERNFNKNGSSGFKIKDAKGKPVATKKAELDDVLDFFSLQLDNPMNVLTQDQARSFLSNSSPAEKYKFFIKGTQLETLDSDYKLLEHNLDSINAKLRTRGEDVAELKRKRDEAEEKKKRGERTDRILQKYREVQRQFAWAQVAEQENILSGCVADVEKQEEEVRRAEEEADGINGRFEAADTAHEAAKRALDQQKEQLDPIKTKHGVEKQKFDDNKTELAAVHTEQRDIKESVKKHKAAVTRLEADVTLERQRLSAAGGAEHAARKEELEELKAAAEEAKIAEQDHAALLPDLEAQQTDKSRELKSAAEEKEQKSLAHGAQQAKLRELQREQGGRFEGYNPNMGALCDAIKRETRWRTKPVGPIGIHIHLLKPEWSSILERTFGGSLSSFLVTSKYDHDILDDIMKRTKCRSSISIGNFSRIDTTGNEPEEDVDTIMRVLRIDEDAVRNTLIIQNYIEQTVLIKDSGKAMEYFDGRPKNVKAVLALGDRRDTGTRYDASRFNQSRSSFIPAWEGSTRMKTDREQQVQRRAQDVEATKREADEAAERHRGLARELNAARQAVERHKRRQKELKALRQEREDEAEGKQVEIDNNQTQDGRLQELERLLGETNKEVRTAEGNLQDNVEARMKLDETAAELKSRLDDAQDELNQANQRVLQAEAKILKTEATREHLLFTKNELLDNVESAKTHATRLEQNRDAQQAAVEKFRTEASAVSARVAVPEGFTPEMLDGRLDALKKEHAQAVRTAGGTREELVRALKETDDAYRAANKDKREMEETSKLLMDTLKERQRRWKLFRKYISARAKINFSYLLSEREFRGRVLLNHDTHQLDINVEPDMARQSDTGRKAKTLSGGEKSFSTICLLLSIWEAMGSPIRCLDEFDVFMDSINRAQSMGLMIQAARRSVGRQFILITPQSMDDVRGAPDVEVYKMADPERGQQTLPFQPA